MDANNSNITPILPAEGMDGTAAASIAAAATAYAQFALQAAALVPGQDGQLVLPSGVSLDNIRVVGRDLVIRMPDGSEVVVPDGAVFVPQFVVDGVAVPPVNLAALLIGQEPQPAAGPPQSSGGNFSQAPGDIGDPFGLGDLLPPTELAFPEPEQRELVPGLIDRDPDVNIQDGGPAGKDVTDNVSEVGLPGTRTNGNVESPGSSAGNGSDSTTGTIIVTSPDGIASITINGVVYTGAGQQITTPNGVLTLGALTGDQIPYTYRLTDNTSGNNTTDVFTVVLTDPDGDSSTARLTIVIADDVPTARNDTDSVAGGTYGPETGNVLSGAGTTSGSAGADTLGADGAAVSGFRAGSEGNFAAVGTTINGQYGTLTLGANGTYTYVRNTNTPGGVTDVFTYQLTDGDGDASTATLTINIGDAPNRIVFVPEIGDGTQVREPHLPARDGEPSGSQFDGNPESTSGTITFNSPDGVGSVTISGVTITPGALPQQVVSNATGTLVITAYSYDPVTGNGSITYTYTLNDNTLNTAGSIVTFPIVVTDLDGDSANDDLNITIIDDAPLAVNDSAAQETENAPVTVNVFTNDTPGADGVTLSTGVAIVAESLSGAGSLAYNGDGTFTYTPAPGEEGTVTFQYTITDGDGDPSTATVTITLLKDSEPRVDVSGENFVDEAGLPARGSEPEGSNEESGSETTGGTIAISTGGDTLQSLVINGTNVTAGGTVTGAHGTLTVSVSEGAYSYSYTLTDNTSGEGTTDSFNVVVTDSDGDSANDTLVIGIHDDAPTAIKDADNIAAGEYGPATGNVITDAEGDGGADTPGADGVTVTAISGFGGAGAVDGTTNGQYGVLTLNADGSYSYARNPGTPGGVSDVFSYTITDGDGDPSTATLTISIDDSKTTLDLPTEGEAGTQVEEAGLPAGSDAGADSELTAGTIAYTAPDGPATVTIDGAAVTAVGQAFTGSFGTLTITSIAPGAIGYEYELTTNTSGDATFDDFAVVVTDQDGDNTPGTLVIDIVDDVPTAREDIDSVTEDAFVDDEGNPQADGNVLTGVGGFDANATDGVGDTEGADGGVVTAVAFDPDTGVDGDEVAGVVNGDTPGEYGSLTLNADGSYTYTLNNFDPRVQGLDSNDTLTESFIYTITDGDGDPSTTTLTITINGSDDRITINGLNVEGPDLIVDEDDLPVRDLEPAGSDTTPDSLTQTGSFTVNGLDGIASVKIGGTEAFVGQTIPSAYGTFTITSISAPADGNATAITIGYSYVLTDNTAHANAGGENFLTELFDVAVTDTDGSTDTDQVEVRIVDDVPTAKPDGTYSVAEQTALTFDALENDVKGADGVNLVTGVAIATNPSKGTVVYNDDGTFTYTPNAGAEGADSFTYTITDGDGDPSTTTVTLDLLADSIPEIVRVTNLTVDEDGFAGANADNGLPGEVTSTNSTSATGTLVASFGADVPTNLLASISLNDSAALDGQLVTLAGLPVTFAKVGNDLVGSADGQEIIRISITGAVAGPGASDVTYTYTATLLQPVQHAVPGSEDSDILSAIGFTVTDSEGDPASGIFAVTVVDDLPTLEIGGATASVTEGGAPYYGVWTLDPGADSMTTLSLNVNGTVQSFTLGGAPATFALPQGTLTFRADGTYTFQPSGNLDHDLPQTVTLTVSGADRDGDPVSDSITITINDGSGPIGGDKSTLTVNEAALDTPAATGSDPVLTTEVASDTLAFTAGSDNLVDFRFAGVADLVANIDGAGTDLFWTLSGDGKTIIGALTDGGPAAITIALTAPASIAATTSGTVGVTVTLADNLPHELALAAQTAGLGTVTVVASDQDGDSATGIVTVQVVDDIPEITGNAAAAATLSVDDTTLTSNATANMSSLFTIHYNADGPAATGSIAYTLSIAADGTDSGVKDTATGQAVLLTNEAGVIVGRTATGGDIVFTVTVNATTGSVTLDQVRAVVHSPDTGANQFFDLAADLINLTATIKDGDGDIDSETVGISQGMRFFDDGLRGASLSVSNEGGVLLTTQDAETIAAASDFAVTTANFSGVFSTSANYGNDLPGTTVLTYALATVGGTPDSGLDSHGAPITLYNIAGVITGSTAASLGAVDATNTIFTIAVGATTGIVTLTQFAEIDHAGPGVDSGFDTQFATLANNLVRLTGTAVYTDGDGDSASLNLFVDLGGNVRFADDGPVLTTTLKDGALLTIDETNGVVAAGTEVDPDATGNLGSATIAIGNLYTSTVVSGADGPATLTYKLIVTDNTPSGYLISSTNESINLFRVSDTVVEGRGAISGNVALTFSIAANGTVTMTQLIAIEHSDTTNHDETSGGMNAGVLLVETTATDFDNDFDKATVDLGSIVRIEDDGPTINVTKGDDAAVVLATQDAETIGGASNSAASAANFAGVFGLTSTSGADGAATPTLSYALTLAVAAGTNSGLTIGGTAIKLYNVGGVIVGSTALSAPASATDASVVFSLGVNGSGVVTLTQYQQIDHPIGTDPAATEAPFADHSVLLANGLVNLTASSTITDNDGDTASDSETIDLGGNVRFDDHGPSVSTTGVVPTLTVDETTLLTDASASFAANFTVNYGADGAGSTVYTLGAVSGASGLIDMATGEAVHLRVVGGVVEGYTVTTNQLVFNVTVNGSGSVTLNQLRAVAHTPNTTADQSTGLTGANLVTLTATATDFDGDTAKQTINIGDKLIFKDDGPAIDIAASGTALIVDESLGTTGSTQNEGGRVNEDETLPGAAVGAFGYATGSIVSLVSANAGADGEASRVYSLTVNGSNPPSGLLDSITNSSIVLVSVNSTTVEGRVGNSGGLLSFRITIDPANGTATINQFRAVEHNDSGNHDENGGSEALMNSGVLSLGVVLTDLDGDQAPDTVDISQLFKFEDDGPAATGESGTTNEILQDFNTAFVIDFSGSIDNAELNTQLVAVKAAISELFGSTGGNVSVKFVLFATDAMASGTFTSAAAANAYLDTVNPTTGGTRPPAIGSSTDFTDAITTLLANYAADETANNQVFFLSDGNPNQPSGLPSGQALMPAVATQWNDFVDLNGINVTAIGVGNGINNTYLQQIDVDGSGAPILVANFDDLIDTLTALFGPTPITGDLDINDDYGTDGGRILSITVPTAAVTDPVYTWNGVTGAGSQITVSGGGATINGTTSFTATTEAGGSLTFNFTTGVWSYTPPRTVPADTTEVFSYTIVDGDGDTATATLSVLVENNELPGTAPVTATVDDDALSGNAGGTGDLDANVGEVPASVSEAIYNGTLNITATDNPIAAISFAQLQGTTATIGQETVTYSWDAVTNLLTAKITVSPDANRVNDTLFTVKLNHPSNGSYTVTLSDNVLHSNVAGENDASVALTYRVADTDGSTNSGVLNITFDDDTPVVTSAGNVALTGSALSATGAFDYEIGADARTTFSTANGDFTSVALSGLVGSSAITNVVTTKTGETATTATFTFSFQYDSDPNLAGVQTATSTGTLSFNKSAGQYTITLNQPIATFETVTTSGTISKESYNIDGSAASQPEIVVSLLDTDFFVRFSGVNGGMNAGGNSTFASGETFSGTQGWVSISGVENGVSSDTLQNSEVLNLDFYTASPGGVANPGAGTARADTIFLKVNGLGSTEDLVVILKLIDPDDNSVTTRAVVVDSGDIWKPADGANPLGIAYGDADGVIIIEGNDYNFGSENYRIYGAQLMTSTNGITLAAGTNAINLNRATGASGASTNNDTFDSATNFNASTNDTDVIKIIDIGFIQRTQNTQQLKLNIDVTVTDADGDSVSQTLRVNGGVPPVALDLDGDGVEFLSAAAGVTFDYAGDGNPESTAWVGADDGLLALDRNGNAQVDDGSEIVFGGDGQTDLEGLAANYDSNKDGVLDASDTDFAKFGVWQDANSNGVTDAGEFQSLGDAGITSINLVSDGVEYAAADGDVTVHGTSSFTRADGTTGEVADASFATSNATKAAANENDLRVQASANTGMASSMVAAGLVAAITGAATGQDLAESRAASDAQVSRTVADDHRIDVATEASDNGALSDHTASSAGTDSEPVQSTKSSSFEQVADNASMDDGGADHGALISDLLAPTEIDHGAFAQPGAIIGMHVDAASEALIAVQQGESMAKAAVEEVVADALAGGASDGPNVDALLNALAGPANDQQLLGDSLAQTFGDHPVFEALSFNSANDMIDQLTITHMELSAATGHHG